MPTSSFDVALCNTMDYVHATQNKHDYAGVGDLSLGGGKVVLARSLLAFNVETAPSSGRPLTPADTIVAAEIQAWCSSMAGAASFACHAERIARDDWDDQQSTWNEYKTGSAWTSSGGDVDPVPAAVAFRSPAASGAYTIAGLAAFVRDALDHHAGWVHLRLKADDENANHEFDIHVPLGNVMRLVVAYTSTEVAETPIASPTRSPLPGPRPVSPAPPARPLRPVRGVRP